MGLPKLKTKISVEDYLEGEKISPVKHEFIEGEVYAMAGTTIRHNIIAGEIYARLLVKLADSKCQPFMSDVKVRASAKTFYYPDVMVSCEEINQNSLLCEKPILIVEVVSPSTEHIDRREKLLFYQQMPSVQEYVIVDQKKMNIEVHQRQNDGRWITYFFDEADDEIEFQSVGLTLPITDIYRRVRFNK
ncbi:MAG: Uma2 family endonuclease [Pyrinomonadaceae bacterium]|nr:Uma2 family endonuclease [Pyrinomonadaceae bacterium]